MLFILIGCGWTFLFCFFGYPSSFAPDFRCCLASKGSTLIMISMDSPVLFIPAGLQYFCPKYEIKERVATDFPECLTLRRMTIIPNIIRI